jgi:hypothetical protein
MTRRGLTGPVSAALGLVAIVLAASGAAGSDGNRDHCDDDPDLALVNGKIHTMDARDSVVSSITIHNGKFEKVGRSAGSIDRPCTP